MYESSPAHDWYAYTRFFIRIRSRWRRESQVNIVFLWFISWVKIKRRSSTRVTTQYTVVQSQVRWLALHCGITEMIYHLSLITHVCWLVGWFVRSLRSLWKLMISRKVQVRFSWNLTLMFRVPKVRNCELWRGQGQSSRSKLLFWISSSRKSSAVVWGRLSSPNFAFQIIIIIFYLPYSHSDRPTKVILMLG